MTGSLSLGICKWTKPRWHANHKRVSRIRHVAKIQFLELHSLLDFFFQTLELPFLWRDLSKPYFSLHVFLNFLKHNAAIDVSVMEYVAEWEGVNDFDAESSTGASLMS